MGILQERVNELLEREVDRKQFLQYSLAIFLAAFGVTGLIQAMLSTDKRILPISQPKKSTGYSSSRYNR